MADHLRVHAPLLYVDPPLSSPAARRDPALTRCLRPGEACLVDPTFARIVPWAPPGRTRSVIRSVAFWSARRAARETVRTLGADVRAVVCGSLNDVLRVDLGGLRVLYATDDYAAGAELLNQAGRRLRSDEDRQLAAADIVVVVSEVLAEKFRNRHARVVLIPNGCDVERFASVDSAALPGDVTLEGPRVGVVGRFNDRIDMSYLEAIADSGVSLLLVGPRDNNFATGRWERLVGLANVQWVGEKPYDRMAGYLRAIDVGVTPYADTQFNRASFPLKTIEYLAAGRAVVSTDLPATRWLNTELVAVATTPREMTAAVLDALRNGRSEAESHARRAFAEQHSWTRRAAEFADLIR